MTEPDAAAWQRYLSGCAAPQECTAMERWLTEHDEHEIEQWLGRIAPARDDVPDPASPHDPAPPQAPFQSLASRRRYAVLAPLGSGGMGQVDRVRDQALERDLAIKSCRPRALDEEPARYLARKAAFAQEVAILAQLEHPAITAIHDVGRTAAGFPAYAMQCLDGQTFAEWRSTTQASIQEQITLILRCAEAIAFAHDRGIVHRDLKPENLIVGRFGAVTVVDWGLAARLDAPGPGGVSGTPAWMAPEQARGAPPDPRQDIWAIGALLLYCFDGQAPQTAPAPRLAQVVPKGLHPLVAGCLAADADQRPAQMTTVVADLRHWLSFGLVEHAHLGWQRRALLWTRKHPRQSAFLLSGLLLMGLLSGLQAVQGHQALTETRTQATALVTEVALDDPSALKLARRQTRSWLTEHPADDLLRAADERFATALDLLAVQQRVAEHQARLSALDDHYRLSGRWLGEVAERLQITERIGLPALSNHDPTRLAAAIRAHTLRPALTRNLLHAYTAARLEERFSVPPRDVSAAHLAAVLSALTADDPAAHALFQLLRNARLGPHEPELWDWDLQQYLPALRGHPRLIDALLSMVAPDLKLRVIAEERLREEANAFWPTVFHAHLALRAGASTSLRRHALIAYGRFPAGLWPNLHLAYAALIDGDHANGRRWITRAVAANPDNVEALMLKAALDARLGQPQTAEALIADPTIAAHLRYHLDHPHGHPMERAATAIAAAGIRIPAGDGVLSPLLQRLPPESKPHQQP